jgi:hypothetical protein
MVEVVVDCPFCGAVAVTVLPDFPLTLPEDSEECEGTIELTVCNPAYYIKPFKLEWWEVD